MGVGDSLEAAATLAGPIPAGSWHLVGDGIVLSAADITYDILWRHSGSDTLLVEFQHHFDPPTPNSFNAVEYEADGHGILAAAKEGDQLVLRFSAAAPTTGGSDGGAAGGGDAGAGASPLFIPNGDGANAAGRIPSIALPH